MRRVSASLWYLVELVCCVVFVSPWRWRKEIGAATARLRSSYARGGSTTADTRAHIVAKAEQGRTAARESP